MTKVWTSIKVSEELVDFLKFLKLMLKDEDGKKRFKSHEDLIMFYLLKDNEVKQLYNEFKSRMR